MEPQGTTEPELTYEQWVKSQEEQFREASFKSPAIHRALELHRHEGLLLEIALKAACVELFRQNELMRNHVNLGALMQPSLRFIPKQQTTEKGIPS